jgi:hypothetical protein
VSVSEFQALEAHTTCKLEDEAAAAETEEVVAERVKHQKKAKAKRWLAVGLGTLVGGVVIGVTGGLAAPLVAAGAGAVLGGGAGAALATTAGIYTIGALFGAGGAGLLAHKTNKRFGKLKEFEFVDLNLMQATLKQGFTKKKGITMQAIDDEDDDGDDGGAGAGVGAGAGAGAGGKGRASQGSAWKGTASKRDKTTSASSQKLHVVININGWVTSREEGEEQADFITPFLEQSLDAVRCSF